MYVRRELARFAAGRAAVAIDISLRYTSSAPLNGGYVAARIGANFDLTASTTWIRHGRLDLKQLYLHPDKGAVVVTQGFCWTAAIFGSVWAMAHRMWLPHVLVLLPMEGLLWFLLHYLQTHPNDPLIQVVVIANLAHFWVRGLYGEAWLAASLGRRGYIERSDLLAEATARLERVKPRGGWVVTDSGGSLHR